MANAYSIVQQVQEYLPPTDLDQMNQFLAFKQQKFDANFAAVSQQIEGAYRMDLMKNEDKEYAMERLNTLVSQVNAFSGADYSSSGVTQNISSHINQVLDDKVMNAMVGTANARKLLADIDDIKKNKPEQYAAQNEEFAKRGLMGWLQDGQTGSSYGGGSYVNYHNYHKELDDAMKNLDKYADVTPVFSKSPDGMYFINSSNKRVTFEEARSIAQKGLSTQAVSQMQIDGWNNYGKDSQTDITANYQKDINNRLTSTQLDIDNLKAIQSTRPTKEGAAAITALEKQKVILANHGKDSIEKAKKYNNYNSLQYELQSNVVLDGIAEKYSFSQTELDIEVNPVGLELMKQSLKKQNLMSGGDLTAAKNLTETEGYNAFTAVDEAVEAYDTDFKQTVRGWVGTQTPEVQKAINDNPAYKDAEGNINYDAVYDGITDGGLSGVAMSNEDRAMLFGAKVNRDAATKDRNAAAEYAVETKEEAMMWDIIQVAMSNKDITGVIDGKVVSFQDYISDLAGIDARDESTVSLLEYLGDSVSDYIHDTKLLFQGKYKEASESGKFSPSIKARSEEFKSFVEKFKDNPKLKKSLLSSFYASAIADGEFGDGVGAKFATERALELFGNQSALDSEIQRQSTAGKGEFNLNYDTNFEDDYTTVNLMESYEKDLRKYGSAYLEKNYADLAQNYTVFAKAGSDMAEYLASYTGTVTAGIKIDKNQGMNVDYNHTDKTFKISQVRTPTKDDPRPIITSNPMSVEGTPLADKFSKPSNKFLQANRYEGELKVPTFNFIKSGDNQATNVPEAYKGYVIADEIVGRLTPKYSDILQKYPQVQGAMNKLLNSNDISLNFIPNKSKNRWEYSIGTAKGKQHFGYFKGVVKDTNGLEVDSLDKVKYGAFTYPQMYVANYLESILLDLQQGKTGLYTELIKNYGQ